MLSVQHVANEFKMNTDELIQKSVKLYVQQQMIKVEAELFRYLKKYGIKSVFEMDEKLKNGSLRENDIIDDFFAIDHLESERERLMNLLKESDKEFKK
jgi:sulfur relay (sulfurtransferase) DsrF/TusC family protein